MFALASAALDEQLHVLSSTESDVAGLVAPLGCHAARRCWATAERLLPGRLSGVVLVIEDVRDGADADAHVAEGPRDTSDTVSVLMVPAVAVTLTMVSLLRSASDYPCQLPCAERRPDHGRGSASDGHLSDPRGAHPEVG